MRKKYGKDRRKRYVKDEENACRKTWKKSAEK